MIVWVWALNVLLALLVGYLVAEHRGTLQVVIQWAIYDEPRMRTIGIQVRSGALC